MSEARVNGSVAGTARRLREDPAAPESPPRALPVQGHLRARSRSAQTLRSRTPAVNISAGLPRGLAAYDNMAAVPPAGPRL